jgi:hypothetical protein
MVFHKSRADEGSSFACCPSYKPTHLPILIVCAIGTPMKAGPGETSINPDCYLKLTTVPSGFATIAVFRVPRTVS